MLEQQGLEYTRPDADTITTGFAGLQNYTDGDGESYLGLVIRLDEDGRYFRLYAPDAYRVPEERAGMFLQACAMVQWRTKLIQFEYDAQDGEVRPVVEFPLEDNDLSSAQLMRCMAGLTQLIDEFHPILYRAMAEGVIEFDDDGAAAALLGRLLAGFPADTLAEALRLADQQRRLDEDDDGR